MNPLENSAIPCSIHLTPGHQAASKWEVTSLYVVMPRCLPAGLEHDHFSLAAGRQLSKDLPEELGHALQAKAAPFDDTVSPFDDLGSLDWYTIVWAMPILHCEYLHTPVLSFWGFFNFEKRNAEQMIPMYRKKSSVSVVCKAPP